MTSLLTRLISCVLVAVLVVGVAGGVMASDAGTGHETDHASGADQGKGDHGKQVTYAAATPDPLIFDIDLAVWTLVVFVLLLAILWKFAWGPIAGALDQREQGIHDHIAAAERANEEAKRNLADYEKKLAEASNEVREMIEEARRDADHTKQDILAQAKSESAAERDRALREIETAKGAAIKQLAETSANLAVDLAGKIIKKKLNPEDHSELIRNAVDGFPAGNPSEN